MNKVYLIGAGPGDRDLITLRGKEILENADCVIYDSLISDEILDFAKDGAKKIFVGKRMGHDSTTQEQINSLLVESAKIHENVVRLKGGDPFVFGRGGEEIRALIENGISFEVVPGVTSAIAVPELAFIPVTDRGISRSFHVFTGHTKDSDTSLPFDFDAVSRLGGTLIFLMGLNNIHTIVSGLLLAGKSPDTPASVISNGASIFEKTVRGKLFNIEDKVNKSGLTTPAIIVIGECAGLIFHYTHDISKTNKLKVGIIGTESFSLRLKEELLTRDILSVNLCRIGITLLKDIDKLKDIFSANKGKAFPYRWVVFTSQNAVKIFFEEAINLHYDFRGFYNSRFACLGNGTASALKKYNIIPDLVPKDFTTDALSDKLIQIKNSSEEENHFLIPRAIRGSQDFTEKLLKNGVNFEELKLYDVKGKLYNSIEHINELDVLSFASRSGAEEFVRLIKENHIILKENLKIASIGDGAKDFFFNNGMKCDILAKTHSAEGLAQAIYEIAV